ncbi:hypothetical protein WOLCODRAFT_165691 [Wolfiporia cocos MD-104 SS10]|uniref:Uncharacterized protein n=1 Tax=Wolfiporia cocos (strain MD-104) TaxID=742152 RepID=A0A2H3JAA6_WOLCO|nr:hypothetical protein WOLCODRAFT_165691 [Wolfiporia cocos MD-104 SS10]
MCNLRNGRFDADNVRVDVHSVVRLRFHSHFLHAPLVIFGAFRKVDSQSLFGSRRAAYEQTGESLKRSQSNRAKPEKASYYCADVRIYETRLRRERMEGGKIIISCSNAVEFARRGVQSDFDNVLSRKPRICCPRTTNTLAASRSPLLPSRSDTPHLHSARRTRLCAQSPSGFQSRIITAIHAQVGDARASLWHGPSGGLLFVTARLDAAPPAVVDPRSSPRHGQRADDACEIDAPVRMGLLQQFVLPPAALVLSLA